MTFDPDVGDGAQFMDVAQLQATLAGYSLVDPSTDCEVTPADAGGLAVDVSSGTARLGGPAESISAQSDVALPSAGTATTTGEEWVADIGTAVALEYDDIVTDSETVRDGQGTTFTAGTDYSIDYTAGEITALSGGALTDGETYLIDYEFAAPRKALVYLDDTGTVQTLGGDPAPAAPPNEERAKAAVPSVPIPASDYLPLASVWIPAGATTISAGDIRSRRVAGVQQDVGRSWSQSTSLPSVQDGLGVGVIDRHLYAVGGRDADNNRVGTLRRLNLRDETWTNLTPMPTGREGVSVGVVNNELYVAGGRVANGDPTATVEKYDPTTDQWSAVASLNTARRGAAAAVLNGDLYVAGGFDTNLNPLASVERYDDSTDSWTTVASLNTARRSAAAAVLDNNLYVAGGLDPNNNRLTSVERYDDGTDSWTTVADMSVERAGFSLVMFDGGLYALGGDVNGSAEKYIPSDDRWEPSAPMLIITSPASGVVDSYIVSVGPTVTEAYGPVY